MIVSYMNKHTVYDKHIFVGNKIVNSMICRIVMVTLPCCSIATLRNAVFP